MNITIVIARNSIHEHVDGQAVRTHAHFRRSDCSAAIRSQDADVRRLDRGSWPNVAPSACGCF